MCHWIPKFLSEVKELPNIVNLQKYVPPFKLDPLEFPEQQPEKSPADYFWSQVQ